MNERRCIFCGRTERDFDTKNRFTVEHIIPEALGNKTLLIRDVCKECNNKLGDYVDGKFINSFPIQLIRFNKGLQGKGGEVPNPFKKSIDKNGNQFHIDHSLQPKVVPRIDGPDENGRVHAVAPDKETLIKALEKKFDRINLPLQDRERIFKQIELKETEYYNPELQIDITIDFNRIWIEMLKIAYEFAFLKLGERYFDDDRSKEIRDILKKEIYGEGKVYSINDLGMYDLNASNEFVAVKQVIDTGFSKDGHIVILGEFWQKLCVLISLFSGNYLYLVEVSADFGAYGITEEDPIFEIVDVRK